MNLTIMQTYHDFFLKKISFMEFKTQIDQYLSHVHPNELTLFYDETTDNPFLEYDADMVMLTYIYLWIIPNRLNQLEQITGSDNIYLSFIKSILVEYDLPREYQILEENFNYLSYQRGNVIIILNTCDTDIVVKVPDVLKNGNHYCINCNDEIIIDETIELYPYGFYLIEI